MEPLIINRYYDNKDGSLYLLAESRGWSSYMFDMVKRIYRGGRKDPLEIEIKKTIHVIDLMISENKEIFRCKPEDLEPYIGNSIVLTLMVELLEANKLDECKRYLNSLLPLTRIS